MSQDSAHAFRAPAAMETATTWTKRVNDFFDTSARMYAGYWASRSPKGEALRVRRATVLALVDSSVEPGGSVLDVGCGSGEMAHVFQKRGFRFSGVDLSAGMLAEARRRCRGLGAATWTRGSAERLPYRDGGFDVVLAMGVLEYTANPIQSIAELVRVVRPGGLIVFTLPHHWAPYRLSVTFVQEPLMGLLRPWYERLTGTAPPRRPSAHSSDRHRYNYTENWLARQLLPSVPSLHIEDVAFCIFKVLPAPLDVLFPDLDAALIRRLEGLGRGPLKHLGTAFIVKARAGRRARAGSEPSPRRGATPPAEYGHDDRSGAASAAKAS